MPIIRVLVTIKLNHFSSVVHCFSYTYVHQSPNLKAVGLVSNGCHATAPKEIRDGVDCFYCYQKKMAPDTMSKRFDWHSKWPQRDELMLNNRQNRGRQYGDNVHVPERRTVDWNGL